MIPGMNIGESAFQRYQTQVYQQIEEALRRKIENFMDHCCMEADGITDTDIEELYEMAGLVDPDGKIGLVEMLDRMDVGAVGLKDRLTAIKAKGPIEGYLRETWYGKETDVDNRPKSAVAGAITEGLERFREESVEDFLRDHPEYSKKESIDDQGMLKKMNDLEAMIIELRNELSLRDQAIEKMKGEIERFSTEKGEKGQTISPVPPKAPETPKISKLEGILKFKTDRYWKVGYVDDNYSEVDLESNLTPPENFEGYIPLRMSVENEQGGRRTGLIQFELHVSGKEHYEMFFNRLRSTMSEYLKKGEVNNTIPVHETFTQDMDFYPRMEGGEVWRMQIGKIDVRHFREDSFLTFTLGPSYLKYFVWVPKDSLQEFMEDVADLLEMVVKTGSAPERREK